jgi:hypothetical protein
MDVWVAPISGGCLVSQIAAILALTDCGFKPELSLGASGGNVALWIGSLGKWNPCKIAEICRQIDSSLFIEQNLVSDILPTKLLSVALGNAYRSNSNPDLFLKKHIKSQEDLLVDEIWIAAVVSRTGRVRLMCNKVCGDTIIKPTDYDINDFNTEELIYMNGDVRNIGKGIIASSSVPFVVNPTMLYGENCLDCGAKFASPLTPLKSEVQKYLCHVVYISGFDVEASLRRANYRDVFDLIDTLPAYISHGHILSDRAVARALVGDHLHCREYDIDRLNDVMTRCKKLESSCIEIFPVENYTIKITSFTAAQFCSQIDCARKNLRFRIWWHEQHSVDYFD